VAEAILYCASHPTRDVFVGAGGKAISSIGAFAPRTTDLIMEATMIDMQKTDKPGSDAWEGLHDSKDSRLHTSGNYEGHVAQSSVYTQASLHPLVTGSAVALGVGGLLYALSRGSYRKEER
jgi:hypothetical protein